MKFNRQFLFGLLAGGAVTGMLLASVWLATGRPKMQRPAPLTQAHPTLPGMRAAAPHENQPADQARQPLAMTPPWMAKSGNASAQAAPAALPGLNVPMTSGGKVDVAAVDAQLDAMIKRHGGNPVIHGVDFAMLKKNLVKVQELQDLASQAQALTQQQKPDAKQVNAIIARMTAVQGEIRANLQASHLLSVASAPKP